MYRRRVITVSLAAAAIGLAGCSSDEPEEATEPTQETAAEDGADDTAAETGADDADTSTDDGSEDTGDADTGADVAGDVPEFREIWPEVMDNTANADSLTADLSMDQGGEQISFFLSGQLDDSNYEIRANMPGQQVEIVRVEDRIYLKGDEGFLQSTGMPNPTAAADQWVVLPEGMDMGDDFSLQQLWQDAFSDFELSEDDNIEVTESELTDLDGVETYRYLVAEDGADVEVWVDAAERTLLKIDGSDDTESVLLSFSEWNSVGPIDAPEGAVPFEDVMGSGS